MPSEARLKTVMERIDNAPNHAPFVVAQLGQSLDGRIATLTGHSRYINRHAALDHLHRIRAHVDGVVVGIGTVIADDPRLNVRRVQGANPARIVIDPQGRMPREALMLQDDGARRIIIRGKAGFEMVGVEEIILPAPNGIIAPHLIVEALFSRGIKKLLIEGGAKTISMFISADAVDRLHVLVAPMIIGSGKPGIELPPISVVDDALRPLTDVVVLHDGDVLFDCDLRNAAIEGEAII
jgi:diaminohydroxyphosphoribosylaminopyrimidine deaminase / 5-amino-6-(5-phosphoribosylamino)uracil reductase